MYFNIGLFLREKNAYVVCSCLSVCKTSCVLSGSETWPVKGTVGHITALSLNFHIFDAIFQNGLASKLLLTTAI